MPFQSEKQRRYLWANEPEIARDWTDTYGSGIAKALGGRIPFQQGLNFNQQYLEGSGWLDDARTADELSQLPIDALPNRRQKLTNFLSRFIPGATVAKILRPDANEAYGNVAQLYPEEVWGMQQFGSGEDLRTDPWGKNIVSFAGDYEEGIKDWWDKYGKMVYETPRMKQKKEWHRQAVEKIRQEEAAREATKRAQVQATSHQNRIQNTGGWQSGMARDPGFMTGPAKGEQLSDVMGSFNRGGRVPLADGNFLGLPQHYQNTDQLRAATRAGLISEPQYKEMSGHDAAENVWGLGSLMGPLQPYTNVAASALYNVDKSIRNPQDYFDPNTYQPRVGPMESIDMNVKGALEGLSPELQEKYEGILDLDLRSLTDTWAPEDLYDFSGVDDDDETDIIDVSNPRLNKAGLGVMSFLSSKFGPKIAAFIKNRALSKTGQTIGPKIKKTAKDIINPRPKTPHGGGGWKSPSGRDHVGTRGIGSAAAKSGPAGGSVGASRFR